MTRKKNDWRRRVKNKEEAASPESSAEEASQEQGKEKRQSPGGAETAPPRAESQKGEVEVLGEHHTEGMRLGFWCLRSLVAALVCMWLSRARPGEIQARLLGCLPSSPCVPGSPLSNGYPWAEGCADGGQGPPVSEEGYGNCTCVWPRTSWATAMPASSCMESQPSNLPNGMSSER
ncbi:uncharacterized protein AAGF69_017157 isoform 1-T1 [Amazona ochrocephala]